ncbi:MAG: choice-of-anchor D domain-containing protein [Candidatus Krumholzibacteria bacterium]|nr:choice-of-anchor D domain-containing protein [Candidatus Krumholzibacteria bacterium]
MRLRSAILLAISTGVFATCSPQSPVPVGEPECTVQPSSVNFDTLLVDAASSRGAVAASAASRDTAITITNTENGILSGDVSLSCTEHYSILSGEGAYSLGPQQSHTVSVRFAPTVTGPHVCSVELNNGRCSGVDLTGVGAQTACLVQPATFIDMDTVMVASVRDTLINIRNTGAGTLSGFVRLSVTEHYRILSGGGPYNLATGQSRAVSVRFEPTAGGRHADTLLTGSGVCQDVSFTGIARDEPPSQISNFGGTFGSNGLGVAVDVQGNAYVTDRFYDRVRKYNIVGSLLQEVGSEGTGPEMFDEPVGIALDPNGNVWVTELANNRMQKLDTQFSFLAFENGVGGAGQFNAPRDVDVDGQGNVYVIEKGSTRVQKFDSNGFFVTSWGTAGTGEGQFTFPEGIAVDASGHVYVVEREDVLTGIARVQKFDSDGNYILTWGSTGGEEGQFGSPWGIDVDADGDVLVADTGNGRIQKFTGDGVLLSVWDTPTVPLDVAEGGGLIYVTDGLLIPRVVVYRFGP